MRQPKPKTIQQLIEMLDTHINSNELCDISDADLIAIRDRLGLSVVEERDRVEAQLTPGT